MEADTGRRSSSALWYGKRMVSNQLCEMLRNDPKQAVQSGLDAIIAFSVDIHMMEEKPDIVSMASPALDE
jgi:hypothetical protein